MLREIKTSKVLVDNQIHHMSFVLDELVCDSPIRELSNAYMVYDLSY